MIIATFYVGYVISDQGAIGKCELCQANGSHVLLTQQFTCCSIVLENIMVAHHYTDTEVKTAAAAVNAGTCLEDANLEANVFTNIGKAVNTVNSEILNVWHKYLPSLFY